MTSVSQNVYIDKLADIVNEYNNMYLSIFKMNPVDVNSSTYIDFGIENNEKDPKFEVDYHVMISKCKKILQKVTHQIGPMKFRVEKVIKEKVDKLNDKWKSYNNYFTVGLIKKILL